MANRSQFLMYVPQPCNEAVRWMIDRLNQSGLQVVQTFDFESARGTQSSCTCNNHGTERCDCQMIVLLVYGNASQPISLMAHGYDGKTWLSLVDTFHASNPALETQVRNVFTLTETGIENNAALLV